MAINAKLLRKFAIYRINYYTPKTNFRPLVFVLFAGALKVHALSLNAPQMTSMDVMHFISFIRRMRNVNNVENYSPRVMYRIIRTYYPNIVKKTYRTYITTNIGAFSLISIGLIKDATNFTDLERSAFNDSLNRDGNNIPTARMINIATKTKYIPPQKAPIYQAPKTMKENEPENIKTTDKINNKTAPAQEGGDELDNLYGEDK